MPNLQLGLTTVDRTTGNFPGLPVINMVTESVPTEPDLVLQSRPGLVVSGTMGAGPIKQLFHKDGILSSSLFGVSGVSAVYQSGVKIGDINGTGYVSMAGFETLLFITAGEDLWAYDGTALDSIVFPEGKVLHVCVGTSRLVAIEKDTGRVYWSDPLTDTIDALSFATAEQSPDRLKHLLFIGDTLILFGTETVEFWVANSSNPDLPFSPVVGRTFQVGIRDTGCATLFAGSFAWITDQNQICVTQPDNIISTPSLSEKLGKSIGAKLWTFRLEGVEYLAVTLDTQTWVLSSSSKTWSTFESYSEDNWVAHCAAGDFFGSKNDGNLIQWSDDYSDFGDILERRFRAGLSKDSGVISVDHLTIRGNPGQTPFLDAPYDNPKIGCRFSKDGGQTFTSYYDRYLGRQGDYRYFPEWRSMGIFGRPGLLTEFRVTDPVPFRVSAVALNEGYEQV